ncbi:MAG: OsmC family protein [Gammaproteobacteria bacterium]|nr:MAG: OsmC family protein [Gammaproteobacteria bacterium]
MKVDVKWVEQVLFLAGTGSGHAVVMDGAPEGGGRNLGPRPMELLLTGLGGCTAYDVVTMLRKGRQEVHDVEVRVEAERAETPPKVFTHIRLHYVVTGRGLRESQVRRAVELSADKYCSASVMLGATARIEHSYELREA